MADQLVARIEKFRPPDLGFQPTTEPIREYEIGSIIYGEIAKQAKMFRIGKQSGTFDLG
jgi:hypothetical protein